MTARAVGPPELAAGGGIVGDDGLRARGDELTPAAAVDDDRRCPAAPVFARDFPDLLARLAIERDDERARAHLLIALQDHELLEEDRRRAGAETCFGHPAERRLPLQVAVDIEREECPRVD